MKVTFKVEGYVTMEMKESIIERAKEIVADGSFGQEATEDGILEHLAYNFVENNAELHYLDGFADLDNDAASLMLSSLEYKVFEKE